MFFHPDAFMNAAPISMLVGKSDLTRGRFNRSFREAVENVIERLIGLLDASDPDADLEPYLAGTSSDDREGDDADDEESDETGCGDYEGLLEQERGEGTDLGCTEAIDQSESWKFPAQDRTQRNCAVTDGEPSLGWLENHGAGWVFKAEPDTRQYEREADDDAEPDTVSLKDLAPRRGASLLRDCVGASRSLRHARA